MKRFPMYWGVKKNQSFIQSNRWCRCLSVTSAIVFGQGQNKSKTMNLAFAVCCEELFIGWTGSKTRRLTFTHAINSMLICKLTSLSSFLNTLLLCEVILSVFIMTQTWTAMGVLALEAKRPVFRKFPNFARNFLISLIFSCTKE